MSVKKELLSSELPTEIQKLIRRVARRTGLRRSEQLDIARELLAHFEDALSTGESTSDAIAAYGDEKTAAKLLRKACKRKRWWIEVALVKAMKCTAICLGCFLVLYMVLVLLALQRKPTIAVDYAAKLNETAAAVPEDERAWPFYRSAGILLNANPEPTPKGDLFVHPTWQGDAGWEEYVKWTDSHSETLDFIREGAVKKGMGYIVSHSIAAEDRELWPERFEKNQANNSEPIIGILFPQLGHIRTMGRLLKYDAILAASEGDGVRCVQDIEAMIHLGTHIREHSTLINDLVSISMYNLAFQTMAIILEHAPEVVPLDQFQHVLVASSAEFEVRFDGERMFVLDLLQRAFTDDGNGDGLVIPQNLLALMSDLSMPSVSPSIFLAPLGNFFIASRKEMIEHFDTYLAHIEKYRHIPLSEWNDEILVFERALETRKADTFLNKYYLLDLLLPVLEKAMLAGKYAEARRDGLLAAIYAIKTYRVTGKWPVNLSGVDIVDPHTGDPWNIIVIDDAPVIYSFGIDRDDDSGKYNKDSHQWLPSNANNPDGDWVIWPNPE